MSTERNGVLGRLVPMGGGDPIPLLKDELLVGRRESCDIVLRFANVSAHHCQLLVKGGYFYVRDLQSRNGVKVNNIRVNEKRLDPGDTLSVAKHKYELHYSPGDLGAVGPPPPDDLADEILEKSLLSRAGLEKTIGKSRSREKVDISGRYNPLDDRAGQIKLPDEPV